MILIKEKSGIYPDFSFWLVPLQLLDYLYDAPTLLWLKVKDTKSESNSQPSAFVPASDGRCGSRSKIQNLKAIHNHLPRAYSIKSLWLKVKDTKSESNSQQLVADAVTLAVVAQGQRYKI